jgi:GNAT superfamily N-acetyltransferase
MAAATPHSPTRVKLDDGSRIELREVHPDDKEALAKGFGKLSPESRYRRFFSSMDSLSAADLTYLTEVDHHDHEAVIALDLEGEPVGVARYVRGYAPETAEVAVVVVDDWQGLGAGTALLERLGERATENGVKRFAALILQENAEAIELFRSIAPEATDPHRTPDGYLELILEVPEGRVPGTPLGRALQTAASGRVDIHPWRLIKKRLQEMQSRPDR